MFPLRGYRQGGSTHGSKAGCPHQGPKTFVDSSGGTGNWQCPAMLADRKITMPGRTCKVMGRKTETSSYLAVMVVASTCA